MTKYDLQFCFVNEQPLDSHLGVWCHEGFVISDMTLEELMVHCDAWKAGTASIIIGSLSSEVTAQVGGTVKEFKIIEENWDKDDEELEVYASWKAPVYMLRNLEEQAALYPDTFLIPSKEERGFLKPGEFAQVHMNTIYDETIERIWVEVVEILQDGSYKGTLANDPVGPGMQYGDEVLFAVEHIGKITK